MQDGVSVASFDRGAGECFHALRRELGVESLGLNAIVLEPGQRGRVHAHEHQEEVFVVIEGELTLVLDGEERTLGVDRAARVAPTVRRQLVNRGPGRLVMLALGGSGEHVGRDGRAWSDWDEQGPGRPPQEVPLPSDLPSA